EAMNAFDIAFDGRLSAGRVQANQINKKLLLQPSGEHRFRDTPAAGGGAHGMGRQPASRVSQPRGQGLRVAYINNTRP
ncbi:hypothetical protein ABT391_38185, partial [Streptomyces jumonjinensis]|uniref:hypothetical protein n=1 Tax=Streptomyces jumonjinensis TaxID=1945 RepID=UPI003325A308